MFIDLRSADADITLDYDLCIIGAGAAGITLARALRDSNLTICLLESGGLEPEDATQSLYEGMSTGIMRDGYIKNSRLRYFGGTTNHWNGWCAPLDDSDFEKKSWMPHSGWPIGKADLDSYYKKAQDICQLGPYDYAAQDWFLRAGNHPFFSGNGLTPRMWQISPPTRFGEIYRKDVEKARNITTCLHANVTHIQTGENGRQVTHVDIATLGGKHFTLRAKRFILACGGIENARILLLSDTMQKNGLGNNHDLVGRFFMDHPEIEPAGMLMFNNPALYRFRRSSHESHTSAMLNFGFSDTLRHEKEILNYCFTFNRPEISNDPGTLAVAGIMRDVLGNSTSGPVTAAKLYGRVEAAPNPDSRVTLGNEKDALGQRKVVLNWSITELDRRSLHQSLLTMAGILGMSETGRVNIPDWITETENNWKHTPVRASRHHMGTTRMSDDPYSGVVDKNCKMHGVDNLYIAGSSVFPTGGWANPTLTIVALALRLAEHIKTTHI